MLKLKPYFKNGHSHRLIIELSILTWKCVFSISPMTLAHNMLNTFTMKDITKYFIYFLKFYQLTIENELNLCKISSSKVTCNTLIEAFIFLLKVRDFKDSLGFAVFDFPRQWASIQPPPTNIRDGTKQLHLIRIEDGLVFMTAG